MSPRGNPMREAFTARDLDAMERVLSEDVVLRSPIFSVPFEGKTEVLRLFAALYETLGEMEYVLDEPGDPAVFAWTTDVDGEPLEGVDLVRYDREGLITEVTVFMRPLRGIAAFADAMAPRLGEGRARRALLRVAGTPPSLMMRALAGAGPRMLGMRRRR